jgi:hypothetical protein
LRFELEEHIDVPGTLIPSKLEEETYFLNSEFMIISKLHYVTRFRRLRKELLHYLENSIAHDSSIESTNCALSKKDVSCVSKMYKPIILIVNNDMSKRSAKSNANDFYPKNFKHAFLLNP